jgi:hypothetical protein
MSSLIRHALSATNASDLLPYGPKTGPYQPTDKRLYIARIVVARQPEGPTGERRKPPAETIWGGRNDQDWGTSGIGGVYKAAAFTVG